MGKRSNFERIPRDFYPTPLKAVPPLIPYLQGIRSFAEPCAGDGALVRHLESSGCAASIGRHRDRPGRLGPRTTAIPTQSSPTPHTISASRDALSGTSCDPPTWLLLETDWSATSKPRPSYRRAPHRPDRPLALDRGNEDGRQTELCLVPLRPSPPGRPDLSSCGWFGAGLVARQPRVRAMRQALSRVSFRLKILWRRVQAACPPR